MLDLKVDALVVMRPDLGFKARGAVAMFLLSCCSALGFEHLAVENVAEAKGVPSRWALTSSKKARGVH